MRAFGWTICLAIGLLVAAGSAWAATLQPLAITSKTGRHEFQVEIADNDASRERGLMFRRDLPPGRGMLFDFHHEQPVSFWMENTYIPLDMLFIKSDGHIFRIEENTEPLSTRLIPSGAPVLAVLEVIGGTARKLGIAAGDSVDFPIFGRH